MGLARVWSIALLGVDAVPVEIEVDIAPGMPGVQVMGLPDAALREARDRIKSAVRNSGLDWPVRHVRLALSPAGLPKAGSGYDLALACGVLMASGALPPEPLEATVLVGELALDGRMRPVPGVLPALLGARRAGLRRAVVPVANLAEAALVDGVDVLGATRLGEVVAWCRGEDVLRAPAPGAEPATVPGPDLADVLGQPEARWALEVAAAGGHHLMLTGPPGTGKTMLAQRLPGLLPPLSRDQALEVTAIHSLAGALPTEGPLLGSPPFVAPHHSTSVAALVGGGSGFARPGAVSRAHKGILFLDEAAEFGVQRLNALRTALEEGEVRHARRDGIARYPARFQLVLASNPCPCAPPRDRDCICSARARRQYLGRLSGPLLDRVDIRVLMRPSAAISADAGPPEDTATVRGRVIEARARAEHRWTDRGWTTNAEVPGPALRRNLALPSAATSLLDRGLRTGTVTARGADRSLRVALTIADLDGSPHVRTDHVATALDLRDRVAA